MQAYYTVTMEGDGESWNIRDRVRNETYFIVTGIGVALVYIEASLTPLP